MKILIQQETLAKNIQELKRVVPSKPQLPILQSILFSVNDEIILSATDLYTGIRTKVLGKIEELGQIAIPAQLLGEVVSLLPKGEVTLETQEKGVTVSAGKTKVVIQCSETQDFPEFPEKKGQVFTLQAQEFEKIISFVPMAVAKDDLRPVLTALLFDGEDKLKVAATDGFRLSLVYLENLEIPFKKLLIPAKSLLEVQRLLERNKAKEVTLTISEEEKQIFCSLADTDLAIRLIDGEFPPYQKILANSFTHTAFVDTQKLIAAIKGALVFAKESSNIVKIIFNNNEISIEATSPSLGKHQSCIECEKNIQDEIKVSFNALYLLDFLNNAKSDRVEININESLQPVLFREEKNTQSVYVVMPFRSTEA
jgi:DNA polymerase-3 subunit beta